MPQRKVRRTQNRSAEQYILEHSFSWFLTSLDWCLDRVWPTRKRLRIPYYTRERGLFLVAPQGGGKSEFLKHLLWPLANNPHATVIVLDPHGEMATEMARWRIFQKNDQLDYLVPAAHAVRNIGFNVLDHRPRDTDDIHQQAQFYGYALETIGGDHFSPLMCNLCRNCLHVLFEQRGSTLLDLLDFLDTKQNSALAKFGAEQSVNPVVRHFFKAYGTTDLRKTREALYNRLQPILADPKLQRILLQPTSFNLTKMINSKRFVVFNFGQLDSASTQLLGQLISAQIQLIAERRRPHLSKIHYFPRIHLICDEAQNFVSELTISQINELRKCRLHLSLATQDVLYLRKNILSACLSLGTLVAGNCKADNQRVMSSALALDSTKDLRELRIGEFYLQFVPRPGRSHRTRAFKKTVPKWLLFDRKHRYWNRRRYLNDQTWKKEFWRQFHRFTTDNNSLKRPNRTSSSKKAHSLSVNGYRR